MNAKAENGGSAPVEAPLDEPTAETGIVAYNQEFDLFHTCPKCRRWFALRLVRSANDKVMGKVRYYRCRRFGLEVSVAEGPPDHCIE